MDRELVLDLYDEDYARHYDERFALPAWAKQGFDFEAEILRRVIRGDTRWLDVGCGTGHLLSRFPGVPRAGLDISVAMLARAKEANPDALFLREGDMRDDVEEWHGRWTLLTCTWIAYCYLTSMFDVEQVIENFARWTALGGACFIPVMDLEDIRPFTVVPYVEDTGTFGGTISITGVSWTWLDPATGKDQLHLVSPQIGHFVEMLGRHYTHIEVVRYPPVLPGWVSRKGVLATGRREAGDRTPAHVTWQPVPAAAMSQTAPSDSPPSAAALGTRELVGELTQRLRQPRRAARAVRARLRDRLRPR